MNAVRIRTGISASAQGMLELLYPRSCFLCMRPLIQRTERFICTECEAQLPLIEPPVCEQCGAPLADEGLDLCPECANRVRTFDLARSYGLYETGLAWLIQGLKYERERALARPLAYYLLRAGEVILNRARALTFVPLSGANLRRRGFNQAELLARELGKLTGLPLVTALRKTRQTEDQTKLKLAERRENVRGAFAPARPRFRLRRQKAAGKRIVLIDDVYTSGATAEECSAALRAAGYEEIYVLTVARSRPPGAPDPDTDNAANDRAGSKSILY